MSALKSLNLSFLVLAHKRKAAEARVRSIQKSEESKKEQNKNKDNEDEEESTVSEVVTCSSSVGSPESIKAAIHKEEVLFVRRVFPHIISLSEEDLGLNL